MLRNKEIKNSNINKDIEASINKKETFKTPVARNNTKYDKLITELKIDETYTNPKGRKRIKFDHVKDLIVPKQDYAFQSDILMLPKTKSGFRYLLVIVDLWSDEIDAEPLKTKNSSEVLDAMKKIFKRPHLNKPFTCEQMQGANFKVKLKNIYIIIYFTFCRVTWKT